MDKQQWPSKYQQSVAVNLERPDDFLNNGSGNNLLENADENVNTNDDKSKNQEKCDRNLRIQQTVESNISEKSRKTIEHILDQVKTLAPIELLYLYLKLPTECSNAVDPLRQPLNPLGSRSEISQTIMWIKTHLEEDPELSLPKQDVYNEYYAFCGPNKIKPLSTADFGKVMKQVYPRVRPRRLGTRGNSRYCYAGLRRRLKLEAPLLPDLSDKPQSTEAPCSPNDLLAAAWTIVREWSERQLGMHFSSVQALAGHLVRNKSVDHGSPAAALVTSASHSLIKGDVLTFDGVSNNKHRETTLQLQRKLQQRSEINREQKRKQPQSPKIEQKSSRSKKCKWQPQFSASTNTSPTSVAAANDPSKSPSQGLQPVCDKPIDFTNIQALPDFSSFQKAAADKGVAEKACDYGNGVYKHNGTENVGDITLKPNADGKVPIPRLNTNLSKPSAVSPKRAKNVKYKAIQPKSEPCDIPAYNPQFSLNTVDSRSHESTYTHSVPGKDGKKHRLKKGEAYKQDGTANTTDECPPVPLSRERLISISNMDKDSLDDYLGTNNSQEQEEEIMKYFEHSGETMVQNDMSKLSQLRQILEKNSSGEQRIFQKNLQASGVQAAVTENEGTKTLRDKTLNISTLLCSNSSAFTKATGIAQYQNISAPSTPAAHPTLNARRRVSFEIPHHEEAVPPSPNTRRKNFSFTPISPGPVSPGGRHSKCSSTTVSPFVSPRNTPVPRAKCNSHQNVSSSYVVNQPVTPSGLLHIAASRKIPNSGKGNFKIKQEPDTSLDAVNSHDSSELHTEMTGYVMSAPPSPKLPIKSKNSNLLQKLLNSNNKVPYTPNYSQSHCLSANLPPDSYSKEISQFFSNESTDLNVETGYRSQSVPIHHMLVKSNLTVNSPLIQNSCMTQFPFGISSTTADPVATIQNEFNDFDTFSATENINMNKILHTLDSCQGETILQNPDNILTSNDNIALQQTDVFPNINDIDISLPVDQNDFRATAGLAAFNQQSAAHVLPEFIPSLRSLGRSQSIDIDSSMGLNTSLKYNPSRSVPGTPVPYCNSKVDVAKNYRSYPSTPLTANESFTYNQSQDYLLNGQPIKDKIVENVDVARHLNFLQNADANEEIFNVSDVNLSNDVLIDNKNDFSFEGQLSENSYGAKHNINPILEENCVVMENEFDFKGVPDVNGV